LIAGSISMTRVTSWKLPTSSVTASHAVVHGHAVALRRSGNAIILARKAGIDPVDASYPKVSCRRKRLHAPAGEETNAHSEHQRT
jgi:hypothetical protein